MRRKSASPQVRTSETARILATVDSESRPYTDPAASYPRAQEYQEYRRIAAGQPRQEDM